MIRLPELDDTFPAQAIQDALSNVREYITKLPEGIVLVDWCTLTFTVARRGAVTLKVKRAVQRRRRRKRPRRARPSPGGLRG